MSQESWIMWFENQIKETREKFKKYMSHEKAMTILKHFCDKVKAEIAESKDCQEHPS